MGPEQLNLPLLSEKHPLHHLHNIFNRLKGWFNRLKIHFNRLFHEFNRLKPPFNRLSHFSKRKSPFLLPIIITKTGSWVRR